MDKESDVDVVDILDQQCSVCRITPRNLEHSLGLGGVITGLCPKCSNLADSMAKIREKERARGTPTEYGGNFWRSKKQPDPYEQGGQLF